MVCPAELADGGKAEMQIAKSLAVNDKPFLRELSSMCLCNDGAFDAEIGDRKWLSEAMGSDLVLPHHLTLSVTETRRNPD